jgi:hypothetical protein
MAKVRLTADELWEVIDAGCIVLGHTRDRTHQMTIHRDPLGLTIEGPGTIKRTHPQLANQTFPTRESAFKNYQPAPYVESEKPARLVIEYEKPSEPAAAPSRRLSIALATFNLGCLAVYAVSYFW